MIAYLVRDGVVLGELAEYGVVTGPWSVTASTERCEASADLYSRGQLQLGDWIQLRAESGADLGRYWYWGPERTWAGRWSEQLKLRSCDGVLELAQVWTPGPLRGITGDAILEGQGIIATLADIAGALGLGVVAPPIDRVAAAPYGWDPGTAFAEVVSDLAQAAGCEWVPGRQGEVLVVQPSEEPSITIEAEQIVKLSVTPRWEEVANVVIAERKSANTPGEAVMAIWDDPTSPTSIYRFVPRVKRIDAPVENADLITEAERTLAEVRELSGEVRCDIAVRDDLWIGDRISIELDSPMVVDITSIERKQGEATMQVTGRLRSWTWDS